MHFFFKISTGRTVSWEALVVLKPLISFKTVFLSMQGKLKFETWWCKHLMEIIIAWFLYLKNAFRVGWLFMFKCKSSSTSYLGISRFSTTLEKIIEAICYFCITWNLVFVFNQSNFFSRFSFVWMKRLCQNLLLSVI